jgi:hypothetical protein
MLLLMTRILLAILIGISVPVLLGTAQEAYGAFLTIDDTVEGQITLSHDPNWEFGVNSAGTPFGARVAGSTTTPGEEVHFSGTWFVNSGGTPDPGNGIIYVTDPNTGKVSDIIQASWSTNVRPGFDIASIEIWTESSPACGDLGALPAGFTGVLETGGFFTLNNRFEDPNNGNPVNFPSNLVAQFGSSDEPCPVNIDIKPGSDPSSVNCKNLKGNVPVAIFGAENFDVIDIEIVSMSLVSSSPIPVTLVHDNFHIDDLNDDGFDDAVLHLDKAGVCEATEDAPLKETVEVELTGETTDGTEFLGIGDIRIVKR